MQGPSNRNPLQSAAVGNILMGIRNGMEGRAERRIGSTRNIEQKIRNPFLASINVKRRICLASASTERESRLMISIARSVLSLSRGRILARESSTTTASVTASIEVLLAVSRKGSVVPNRRPGPMTSYVNSLPFHRSNRLSPCLF